MGAGEGGKDKLSGVGLTLTDMHARYFLIGLYKVRHIGKIKLRIDAQGIEVHADGDDVRVACPFAVAKERSFYAVRTGEHGHFCIGNTSAAVIVGMDGKDNGITVGKVLGKIGHLGGKDMGHGHLHRRWQVDDDLPVWLRFPHVEDCVADFQGVFWFRPRKAFW